jgi:hypothetical protein
MALSGVDFVNALQQFSTWWRGLPCAVREET